MTSPVIIEDKIERAAKPDNPDKAVKLPKVKLC